MLMLQIAAARACKEGTLISGGSAAFARGIVGNEY
jgi:hypothetical protein